MRPKILLFLSLCPAVLAQQSLPRPGANGTLTGSREREPLRSVSNPGAPTTRQAITPAGIQTVVQGRIHGVEFGTKPTEIWLLRDGADRFYKGDLIRVDWNENRILERIPIGGTPGLQGLAWDRGRSRLLVTAAAAGKEGLVSLASVQGGALAKIASGFGSTLSGGPAASTRRIVVPLSFNGQLAILNSETGALEGAVPLGVSPFGAAISADGGTAWVSNWGGRIPKPGELSAPLGTSRDRAVVDVRGVAASGTVQRVDLEHRKVTHTVETGLHPTALAWDEKRHRLYVANTNADSITIVDTSANRALGTLPLDFFEGPAFGIAPTALALSPDGTRLWIACAGINAVAQYRTEPFRLEGLIPTAYYPHALAVSPGGEYLLIGTFFGVGEGSVEKPNERHPFAARSTAHVVAVPEEDELAAYTEAVAENTRLPLKGRSPTAARAGEKSQVLPVPRRTGGASPIRYVVYIIKENQTYDAIFGGVKRGNGDPSLSMYGPEVAPNHHKLAQQYALFDNFYSTGYHSHDGHAWMTQANTVAYLLWPGWTGRGYPFNGIDPLTYSKTGFLWNRVLAAGKTFRTYGEFANGETDMTDHTAAVREWQNGADFSTRFKLKADITGLNAAIAANYPPFSLGVPDVARAQIFLKDLARWNESGGMPNLVMMQLPMDHTVGNSPGRPTPKACVADNDLALGLIVEGLTRSKFWPEMAIFVAEDDGLASLDHVDGRRVPAFAISPYARRGIVDSTFYSHTSMVKTIELILGVEPMTLFDRIATDMRAAFTAKPDFTAYKAETPHQSLLEQNPAASALRGAARKAAIQSAGMNFSAPDTAPMARLNRIIWHSVRGWDTAYPPERRAAFLPTGAGEDEDER
jgi:DNA-binding beta-propeller fold protein YncE